MSWFSCIYAKPYNEYHNYDQAFFNQNEQIKKAYEAFPVLSRAIGMPVSIIWGGIKTALSPLVDLVCLVVFPYLFVKTLDRKYFWGGINALVNLAFVGGLVTLTVFSIGTGWQTTMISLCITYGSLIATPKILKCFYLSIRGPLHGEDDKGYFSTFFHRFSIKQTVSGILNLSGINIATILTNKPDPSDTVEADGDGFKNKFKSYISDFLGGNFSGS